MRRAGTGGTTKYIVHHLRGLEPFSVHLHRPGREDTVQMVREHGI